MTNLELQLWYYPETPLGRRHRFTMLVLAGELIQYSSPFPGDDWYWECGLMKRLVGHLELIELSAEIIQTVRRICVDYHPCTLQFHPELLTLITLPNPIVSNTCDT